MDHFLGVNFRTRIIGSLNVHVQSTLGTSDINYFSVSRVEHSRRGYDSIGLSSVVQS
jgi:hypothetical protein